jgi:hypothetical protein
MRWKLLVLSAAVTALSGCGLWCAITIALFGSATSLARHGWLLIASLTLPLAFAAFAGVFVYRHTARRRKTQTSLAVLLTLSLTGAAYLAASLVFPQKLIIPRTYEVRHAR